MALGSGPLVFRKNRERKQAEVNSQRSLLTDQFGGFARAAAISIDLLQQECCAERVAGELLGVLGLGVATLGIGSSSFTLVTNVQ
jgi:hypothetical protein